MDYQEMLQWVIGSTLVVLLLVSCGVPQTTPVAPTVSPTATPEPAPEPTPTKIPVVVQSSLPYAQESPLQKLDFYLPAAGDGPFPTILAIHGGGFRAGSKAAYQRIAQHYARQGYALVSINYRLIPGDSYPAQVEDSFCALAWLHAHHEEYGFDPNRVVVMGGSAGGYLAAMLGTVGDPGIYLQECLHEYPSGEAVQAVVIFYGFYDFTLDEYSLSQGDKFSTQIWGPEYKHISDEMLEEMSPIKHIDGSEPPFIILHGTEDTSVPDVMSERFAEALQEAGIDVELILLPGVGHTFELTPLTGAEMTLSLSEIEAFLDRVLAP